MHTDTEQQMNQATDTASQLQDELIQAAATERRLLQQLGDMEDQVNRLQTQHFNVQKNFDDFKRCSAHLLGQEMKDGEGRSFCSSICHCFVLQCI